MATESGDSRGVFGDRAEHESSRRENYEKLRRVVDTATIEAHPYTLACDKALKRHLVDFGCSHKHYVLRTLHDADIWIHVNGMVNRMQKLIDNALSIDQLENTIFIFRAASKVVIVLQGRVRKGLRRSEQYLIHCVPDLEQLCSVPLRDLKL